MKNFSSKRALLLSLLSMVICVSMLIGSTFAWITDSATANVNEIKSGNLDIVLEKQNADGTWSEVSENTALDFLRKGTDGKLAEDANIFWEPGCTFELPMLRIRNNGNLALKYQVVISGATGDTMLLDVIKFKAYVGNDTEGTAVNVNDGKPVAEGMLVPAEKADETNKSEQTIKISAHMDETANNDYKNLKVTGITITVVATQTAYEYDSNGNTYDNNAQYPYVNYVHATGTESLKDAIAGSNDSEKPTYIGLADGEYNIDSSDVIGAGTTLAGAGKDKSTINADKVSVGKDNVTIKDVTIKGSTPQGNDGSVKIGGANTTIDNVKFVGSGFNGDTKGISVTGSDLVIRNSEISNAFRGIIFWDNIGGNNLIENCTIDNVIYTFNINASTVKPGTTLTVKNSTLNGWTSYSGCMSLVSFEKCNLGKSNGNAYLVAYADTTFTDCTFNDGYKVAAGNVSGKTITITNCKLADGTVITAENFAEKLGDVDNDMKNNTVIVNGTTVTFN